MIVVISFLFFPGLCRADYDYIVISNPFLKKIPVAVPLFKVTAPSFDKTEISSRASDLLSDTLEFTGYFRMLDRDMFLATQESEPVALNINFKRWTIIGAEFVVTGNILVNKDGMVEMELRLYDCFKERLLIGKRYKGWMNDRRRMIRRFCTEVIYRFTGSNGIFDSKIAFVSTGTGNKEIYTCDFDGFDPKQLTHINNIVLFPAWSSDGKWIAYTSYAKGKPDLYIKNLREKRGAVIAKKGINTTPAWIPGKFALAATLSFSGDQEIYMLTGAGKIIKRLTFNRGIDVSPSFSKDGKKMAFVSKRAGTPQIYIKSLETGHVKRLTFHGRYNTQPAWSPIGDKIAYSSMANGEINIYVIDADGGNPVQLTYDSRDNESPAWSPDGSLIAFSSTREGLSRIYVMTVCGTDQRPLLVMPGEQSSPVWN